VQKTEKFEPNRSKVPAGPEQSFVLNARCLSRKPPSLYLGQKNTISKASNLLFFDKSFQYLISAILGVHRWHFLPGHPEEGRQRRFTMRPTEE
jgi:hypothetical protein